MWAPLLPPSRQRCGRCGAGTNGLYEAVTNEDLTTCEPLCVTCAERAIRLNLEMILRRGRIISPMTRWREALADD